MLSYCAACSDRAAKQIGSKLLRYRQLGWYATSYRRREQPPEVTINDLDGCQASSRRPSPIKSIIQWLQQQ